MDTFTDKIQKLRSCYDNGYAFADWHINAYKKYLNRTKIYYDSSDNNSTTYDNVVPLSIKREPVNIAMKRFYDKDKLERYFGYRNGIYGNFRDSVNISLFARTMFYLGESDYKELNILSVIAPAFDTKEQPDFYYFNNDDNKIIKRFELIFDMIFNCALEHKLDKIFLTVIGIGFFNNGYSNYKAGFEKSYNRWKYKLQKVIIFYLSYNPQNEVDKLFPNYVHIKTIHVDYNNLRGFFDSFTQDYLNKTLIIHPWDPLSIVGNGNFKDNSWDGFLGRDTSLGVLSYPLINNQIEYIDIANL